MPVKPALSQGLGEVAGTRTLSIEQSRRLSARQRCAMSTPEQPSHISPTPESPRTVSIFAELGLREHFDLAAADVQRAYLQRIAALGAGDQPGDEEALAATTERLNLAKATLIDVEARGGALLHLLGGPSAKEDRGLPPELLGEMMDRRSAFDEAQTAGDAKAMEQLRRWAARQREERITKLADLFAAATGHVGIERTATLAEVRRQLNAMRYIERMLEQIKA